MTLNITEQTKKKHPLFSTITIKKTHHEKY